MTKREYPKYVYEDRGYLRFIRRSKGQSEMIKAEFGTQEFWEEYSQILKGRNFKPSRRTMEQLILSYYESDGFKSLASRTKQDYIKYLNHIREIWGDLDPLRIETYHIVELQKANSQSYRQANYLVQVLRIVFNHARLIGFLKKEHANPAEKIPMIKQKSDGYLPWPEGLIEAFPSHASPLALIAFELALGTGQRPSDVLKIQWNEVIGDEIHLRQGKGDKSLVIPLTDRLKAFLAQTPKQGFRLLLNAQGKPATYKTMSENVRDAVLAAGFDGYSMHGLRKNATRELYIAGCDDALVQAVTGHSTTEMLKLYGGEVRQISLARQAIEKRNQAASIENKSLRTKAESFKNCFKN